MLVTWQPAQSLGSLSTLVITERYILFTVQWPYFFFNSKQLGSHWYPLDREFGQQEHVLSPNLFFQQTANYCICRIMITSLHPEKQASGSVFSQKHIRSWYHPVTSPLCCSGQVSFLTQPALLRPPLLTDHPDLSDLSHVSWETGCASPGHPQHMWESHTNTAARPGFRSTAEVCPHVFIQTEEYSSLLKMPSFSWPVSVYMWLPLQRLSCLFSLVSQLPFQQVS